MPGFSEFFRELFNSGEKNSPTQVTQGFFFLKEIKKQIDFLEIPWSAMRVFSSFSALRSRDRKIKISHNLQSNTAFLINSGEAPRAAETVLTEHKAPSCCPRFSPYLFILIISHWKSKVKWDLPGFSGFFREFPSFSGNFLIRERRIPPLKWHKGFSFKKKRRNKVIF